MVGFVYYQFKKMLSVVVFYIIKIKFDVISAKKIEDLQFKRRKKNYEK